MNSIFQLVKQVYNLSKDQTLERDSQLINWKGSFTPNESNLSVFGKFHDIFATNELKGCFSQKVALNICSTFSIPLNTDQDNVFFKDVSDFFSRFKALNEEKRSKLLDRDFYIIKDDLTNLDVKNNDDFKAQIENFNSLSLFLKTLKNLAHHSAKNEDLIFISHSEKKDISIIIPSKLMNLPDDLLFETYYDDFLTSIFEEGSNEIKAKSIFRSSLNELLEKTNQADKLQYILRNYKELNDIYNKNYEVFVHGVSLSKIKSELAQEQLKLFDSVNKGMQEVTNRVMLIPGFAFLSMMLRSQINSQINNSFIIGIALLAISCIILISIINQSKILQILHQTSDVSIENISKVSVDIQKSLQSIKDEMQKLIEANKKTLFFYEKSLWVIPPVFILSTTGWFSFLLYLVVFYKCWQFLKRNY